MKINIKKIKIINTSNIIQRIHILPISSPYFSINFYKKGNLAPGICEEISIEFKPNEYKYYSNFLRIHCDGGNLCVPIHAFPIFNFNSNKIIFPKLIDFGILSMGDKKTITQKIECNISLNFEFEFIYKKNNDNIEISPMKGIIPGNSYINIDIKFTPKEAKTLISEVELHISQFNFVPQLIKIVGSGMKYLEKNKIKLKSIPFDLKKKVMTKVEEDIDLTINRFQIINKKNNTKNLNKKTTFNITKKRIKIQKSNSFLKNTNIEKEELKTKDTSNIDYKMEDIKNFINKYNLILKYDKEKEVKIIKCIGDNEFNKYKEIDNLREDYINNKNENKVKQNKEQFKVIIDYDLPIISNNFNESKTNWDLLKNDLFKLRRMTIKKLTDIISKLIIRMRAQKRLIKIKNILKNCKTKNDVIELVKNDCNNLDTKNNNKIKFEFLFSEENIQRNLFSIQFDDKIEQNNLKFDVKATVGFDDLVPIEELNFNEVEVMKYDIKTNYNNGLYPPIMDNAPYKNGAEEEYGFIDKLDELNDLENKNIEEDDIFSLYENDFEAKKNVDLEIPCNLKFYNYNNQFELFKTKNNLLKSEKLLEYTEIDPEFKLNVKHIDFLDVLNPEYNFNLEDIFLEYLATSPGLHSLRIVNHLEMEIFDFYKKRYNLPSDIFLQHNIENLCPELLNIQKLVLEKKNNNIDEEIEMEDIIKSLNLKEIDSDFYKKLEKLSNNLIDITEDIKNDLINNLTHFKYKNISKIKTIVSDYNKYIINKENKLIN